MSTINLVVKLTLYILAGFAIVRSGKVPRDFHKQFSSFLMVIPMPALIIRSFYNTELSSEIISQFGPTTLCTVLALAVLGMIGVFAKKIHRDEAEGHICIYGMMTSNFNFFGMPIVEALFGNEGIFYYTLLTVVARVVYYGFPPYLLGDGHKLNMKEFAKQMVCAPIIAIAIGFVVYFTQIRFPEPAVGVMDGMANMASPMGMMLCGMTLANANLKEAFSRPMPFVMCFFRLMIAPAAVMVMTMLCGFSPLISKLTIIYSMLPFGALMPTFATRYCTHEHSAIYASVLVSLATVLSVFTVPIWIFIFQHVL